MPPNNGAIRKVWDLFLEVVHANDDGLQQGGGEGVCDACAQAK
jgi:hypothetical protein